MKLSLRHIKRFISIACTDGLGMAVKKTVSFMQGRVDITAKTSEEREFPQGYAPLQGKFAQLKKSITAPECQGVFILGSQCVGWNKVFEQHHHHIVEYLLKNGYTVLCAMGSRCEKDNTETIREERENLYLVNFDDRSMWRDTTDFIVLNTKKAVYYHLVGTEHGTTTDEISYLKSLGVHIIYDYFDEVSELSKTSQERHTQLLRDPDVLVVTATGKLYQDALQHKQENVILSANGVCLEEWGIVGKAPISPENEEPILSVVIPTYNMVSLLSRCVDSLLQPSIMERLEVIIVNDGSQDASIAVARWYADKYPKIVSVIDKENGGHGSCINAGIRAAKGRYYKLVDSDDWLDPLALIQHIHLLDKTDADMVVTNYKQSFETGGTFSVSYADRLTGKTYSRDELFVDLMQDIGHQAYAHMHAITYKTSLLKDNAIALTEKSFYVDQEYIAYPQAYVKSAVYQEIFLYRYLIGRPGQSVNAVTARKRSSECYRILKKILAFLEGFPKGSVLREYLEMVAYHQAYFFLNYGDDSSRKQEIFVYFEEHAPKFKDMLASLL